MALRTGLVARSQPVGRGVGAAPRQETRRVPDDLALINANVGDAVSRWASADSDEATQSEWLAQAPPHKGDDFVHIPLPRVAAVGDRQIMATAIADYRRETAVIDVRLEKLVSLSVKGMSFADLSQRLHAQTGVDFAVDPNVADDKVTIFCTRRSLRDLMHQISRLFGLTYRRVGMEGAYRYTLTLPLAADVLEAEWRNRDRIVAISQIDADMQGYRPYLNLTPDQALRDGRATLALIDAAKSAGRKPQSELEERLARLDALCASGWAGIHLYFSMTSDQHAALAAMEPLAFKRSELLETRPTTNAFPLPPGLEAPMLDSLAGTAWLQGMDGKITGVSGCEKDAAHTAPSSPAPGKLDVRDWASRYKLDLRIRLQIVAGRPGSYELRIDTDYLDSAGAGGGSEIAAAVGYGPTGQSPDNERWARHYLSQTAVRALVGVRLDPATGGAVPRLPISAARDRMTYADVLEQLHRATGIDILSDFFTRLYTRDAGDVSKAGTLYDTLNRTADALGLHWTVDTAHGKIDWLKFRDVGFSTDRSTEVPARLLERWSHDRRAIGFLPLADLLGIAALTDAQLDAPGAEDAAIYLNDLPEWELAVHGLPRELWRFLQTLSPAQQRALWGANGLEANDLTPEQRRMYSGRAATRLFGQYEPPHRGSTATRRLANGVRIPDPGSIDIDFRRGEESFRVGTGGYGY